MPELRVIVYEERELIASSVVALLRSLPEIAWVQQAATSEDVLWLVRSPADLLVIGVMTDRPWSGLEVLQRVRRLRVPLPVLLLYDDARAELIVRGLELGADGACLFQSDPGLLRSAIAAVIEGQVSLPDALVGEILHDLRDSAATARTNDRTLDRLTDREQQVLRMLSEGHGREQIAAALGVSTSTVRSHVQHVMNKLGVHSQLQAAAEGRRLFGRTAAG